MTELLQKKAPIKPFYERIIDATCEFYGLSEGELRKDRGYYVVHNKHICWYLIREDTGMSFASIAKRFNISDQKTVRVAVDNIAAKKNMYTRTLPEIRKIRELVNTLA
jgi:chromosomal replication initiation ATPase DnaA